MGKRKIDRLRTFGGIALAAIAGCHSLPLASSDAERQLESRVGVQTLLFDVDPLRGAVFERPIGAGSSPLRLAADAPHITHDPTTHKTRVALQVTNAGAALSALEVRVGDTTQRVSPTPRPDLLLAAGGTQVLEFEFDNPTAASFSFSLNFSGQPAPRKVLALTGVTATASSAYSGLTPARAVDGDLGTQWSSGGYREPEAWLTLDTGSLQPLGSLAIKTPPLSGTAAYQLEVSSDGRTFQAVTGRVKNTGWTLENRALPAGTQGRYLRVHFFNDPAAPTSRFSVFEAQITGGPGSVSPSPSPSSTPSSGSGTLTASADSSFGALTPNRAIDGDINTQWSNDGYAAREAWLALDTGAVRSLSSLSVKMRPQSGGAYYRIEVSSDGVTYQTVTGNLKNTSWFLEPKSLPAGTQGRYVRLHFFNDPTSPEVRFSVFEAVVNGGGNTPAPSPSPTTTPSPTPTSSTPTGSLSNNFEQYALGVDPSEFIDPNDEGYSYSWMPRVTWKIVDYKGSKQYEHDGLSNIGYLNFRRYRGTALGTRNGELPARYFAEVDVTPIMSYTYRPTGEQGTQFYYIDPTHYFELMVKPTLFEVWIADNAPPFQSSGWRRLFYSSTTTEAGQTRKFSVEIDTTTQTAKCYLDGRLMTTLTHPFLSNRTHYLSLRGTGTINVHDNLKIQPR